MNANQPITTCQICGRPILANTGVIAHHGYKRPGNGWQTSSCMGAKHLPYEQSCDLIPVAINAVSEYLKQQELALEALVSNPPETLTRIRNRQTITVSRPDGFNPATVRRTYRPDAYDTLFFQREHEIRTNIANAKLDLGYLVNRLAAWVAPAAGRTALRAGEER